MYCKAEFWRPTGLGNRLFSWSRAIIFTRITKAKMLDSSWFHLRGASIIRGGINYRNALYKILLFDNFKKDINSISGIRKHFVNYKSDAQIVTNLASAFELNEKGFGGLVSFSGKQEHNFKDLYPFHSLIYQSLLETTKKKWLSEVDKYTKNPFIGLNIRLGNDFKKANRDDFLKNSGQFLQTPVDWYIDSLRLIRKISGNENALALIVTDGNKTQLKEILREPNVILCTSKSAISDLLILSKSSILLGSGGSSFSAWASFLGKMPTLSIRGASLQKFYISESIESHYVDELNLESPSSEFVNLVKCLNF